MPEPSVEGWGGDWELYRSDNWAQFLQFQGVPEEKWAAATAAPDLHRYSAVSLDGFTMHHRIPAVGHDLQFSAKIDGEWCLCPYKRNTAGAFGGEQEPAPVMWRNSWLEPGVKWQTELTGGSMVRDGFGVVFSRELTAEDTICMELEVREADGGQRVVGPCYRWLRRAGGQ